MNFDSPAKPKARRKSTAEPTMTMHTRAATNEIYDMFNQPLKAETEEEAADSLCESDYEDDDCTSVGESTVTERVSVASSDFGDNEATRPVEEEREYDEGNQGEAAAAEWTELNEEGFPALSSSPSRGGSSTPTRVSPQQRQRFIPEMPDDYDPPCGPYRDPAVAAQNRLPFMTPIVEQTEYSLATGTTARSSSVCDAKTPSRPNHAAEDLLHIEDLLLCSPVPSPQQQQSDDHSTCFTEIVLHPSPTFQRPRPRVSSRRRPPVIPDTHCNPNDGRIRMEILEALDPPLASYSGYHDHSAEPECHAYSVQRLIKAMGKRPQSGDALSMPVLRFSGAERNYVLRRELGAGAYAPVYLAESMDGYGGRIRQEFEAIKMEAGSTSVWEFHMLRAAHERLKDMDERAADSIVQVHELHVFGKESFLVEDYRGQGTLLDLANFVHGGNAEGGVEETLAIFFGIELFRTLEALHSCDIIHGDVKADNCLVRFDSNEMPIPSLIDLDIGNDEDITDDRHYSPRGAHGWRNKGLALIDFGRAIDMRAFDVSVQFIADWKTKDHECNEIREMRPWTHQTDLYGMAGTIHVLLFGKYMETISRADSTPKKRTYRIRESFKRYWDRDLWNDVFDLLLNPGADRWARMESSSEAAAPVQLPVLNSMRSVRERMEMWLVANAVKKGLSLHVKKLEGIFAERKRRLER